MAGNLPKPRSQRFWG